MINMGTEVKAVAWKNVDGKELFYLRINGLNNEGAREEMTINVGKGTYEKVKEYNDNEVDLSRLGDGTKETTKTDTDGDNKGNKEVRGRRNG